MASDGSEVDSLICDGPIRQGGRFRDQSQNRLAVGSGWFHGANVVQRRGQDSVCRESEIFAGPDVGLVFEDFDGRMRLIGRLEVNQEAATELRRRTFIEIFGVPEDIAARLMEIKIVGPVRRRDAHIRLDKWVPATVSANLFVGGEEVQAGVVPAREEEMAPL